MKGTKYDDGKPNWNLLPIEVIEEAVKILTIGQNKYPIKDNWKHVEPQKYYSAMMRHLVEYKKGNSINKESGKHHLSHVLTNLIFLVWHEVIKR